MKLNEKTALRKIRKIVKYWFDDLCPKCGGEIEESPRSCRDYSFECINCGFQLPNNHNHPYIKEIDDTAKEGLKS